MRKRIRKKYHKEYLSSFVYAISVSKYWREKLFNDVHNQEYCINTRNLIGLESDVSLVNAIKRYNLKYSFTVRYDDDSIESQYATFYFWATEFPELESESYNNSNVI